MNRVTICGAGQVTGAITAPPNLHPCTARWRTHRRTTTSLACKTFLLLPWDHSAGNHNSIPPVIDWTSQGILKIAWLVILWDHTRKSHKRLPCASCRTHHHYIAQGARCVCVMYILLFPISYPSLSCIDYLITVHWYFPYTLHVLFDWLWITTRSPR